MSNGMSPSLPKTQVEWRKALDELPSTPNDIPAFFFGHGSPMLAFPESGVQESNPILSHMGPKGPLATFLRDFGPALMEKYKPKGIVVFSAHWETVGERAVTDYGDLNPLLMDYFGFQPSMYELKFISRGDSALSQRVVQIYKEAGHQARTTSVKEARGQDGRGFSGPGLDHGVFIPFRLMFGNEFLDIPIVQVSIDGSLNPEKNWEIGKVVAALRQEGILVLSGGLMIHNLRDLTCFSEGTAGPAFRDFDKAVLDAIAVMDPEARKEALYNLTRHAGFRAAHPRAEHFVPLYVAAGAGGERVKVLSAIYGSPTFAFVTMERSVLPPSRSASLPIPRPKIGTVALSFVAPSCNSGFVGGPITPPLSPGNSEDGEPTIVIDTELRYSRDSDTYAQGRPDRTGGQYSQDELVERSEQAMDVDPRPPSSSPRPPLRHLEDEECHLERGTLKLTDFEVKGTLGTGTFGRVLLVRPRNPLAPNTQNCFALKILRKSEIVRLRQVEHVNAERYILSRVCHPFVVDLYATFQDSLNIYMLLSYVPGGELFTHLRRARRFTPDVTRFYLATIILALKYLHSFNIIYRDLKPENLLLDSRGYLRLTDFGFAKIVDDRTWTLCGTPEYLAPEIIQSDGHGKAADWWACGILCYEMVVGYPPFFDETAYGIYEKILKGKIRWPSEIDPLTKDIIQAFLHPDRSKRLGNLIGGPQDVLEHPWFRGVDWDALERREIRAPIIPHVTSLDDTRHFSHLPLPPAAEIPGLIKEEEPPALQQRFDPTAYQFMEF
ncbi:uncharacterized protein FIBRA_05034 [Fibroporia radiculosa]|uniref:cAMP-dependent protein kinase n=1 Tax=Fibroporia radiculosa TaxID=599839 RepID=J4GQA2_9APHY|nr:uncharacterized protein FIBRA_05034 [Fibroporia radiculosa]CCM02920.1 predicted protein [Fibroporia radiculosa]